jgi:hypothetical protein
MKSSIDYAERMGLTISLSNLKILPADQVTEDILVVVQWMTARLKELENK